MFEIPDAKRVRRDEWNRTGSESDDGDEDEEINAELEARLNAQLAKSLAVDLTLPNSPLTQQLPDEEDEEEDENEGEFSFRLFSSAGASSKVILEDESAPLGEGGLVSSRSLAFYLAPKLSREQKGAIHQAAVSGDDVLLRSKRPAWGLEMPWKVTKISVSRGTKTSRGDTATGTPDSTAQEAESRKRKRPGKKKRIGLRIKEKAKEEQQAEAVKNAMDKEEHVKEKKKRLNKLKKMRKRAKNREKKADGVGNTGDEPDGSSGEE